MIRLIIYATLSAFILSACARRPILVSAEKTIIRDTTIYLPSAIVRDTIPKIVQIAGERVIFERITTDTANLVRLRIYYDNALQRVIAECKAEPRIITIHDTLYRHETKIITPPVKDGSNDRVDWKVLIIIGFVAGMALWITREGIRLARNTH